MTQKETVRRLLSAVGQSYAAETGIKLTDKPAPLYRLLVLSMLLSTPINAELAVAAAAELAKAGLRSPKAMAESSWQYRVDALGRAHYRRYDEQTATALGQGAERLLENYAGDLRKLRSQANRDPERIRKQLTGFPRLGPVGADIFAREAQLIWPEFRPFIDKKALQGAEKLGLPNEVKRLARLVEGDDLARFAAALVRVALRPSLAEELG